MILISATNKGKETVMTYTIEQMKSKQYAVVAVKNGSKHIIATFNFMYQAKAYANLKTQGL